MKVYIVYIATDSSSSIGEFHDTEVGDVFYNKEDAVKRIQEYKIERPETVWSTTHYSILERSVS